MGNEAEAFKVWWSLHPTLVDTFLLLGLITFFILLWKVISVNKKERQEQILDLNKQTEVTNALLTDSIAEIKNAFLEHSVTMQSVVEKLQDEKRLIGEHLIRHEKIAEDITRLCRTLDDHEARIRVAERRSNRIDRVTGGQSEDSLT
jgi:hypothetical protein